MPLSRSDARSRTNSNWLSMNGTIKAVRPGSLTIKSGKWEVTTIRAVFPVKSDFTMNIYRCCYQGRFPIKSDKQETTTIRADFPVKSDIQVRYQLVLLSRPIFLSRAKGRIVATITADFPVKSKLSDKGYYHGWFSGQEQILEKKENWEGCLKGWLILRFWALKIGQDLSRRVLTTLGQRVCMHGSSFVNELSFLTGIYTYKRTPKPSRTEVGRFLRRLFEICF